MIRAFEPLAGKPDYNPPTDITQDGLVNENDLRLLCDAFMAVE
ncbi:MAG: hypothetical protein U9P07_05945 [Pseudomonadota bacterium]|nr:hypothetical protein [Pseudomonadota bacterium]